MRTIIICSGGEDGKDVRTAIRIEDALFEKMFGSHIKDAMSFDDVELYFEGYVDRLKATCNGQDIDTDTMSTRIKSLEDELDRRGREIRCLVKNSKAAREMSDKLHDLEDRLEEMAKQRDYFKDKLDKRDREIEQLKETVVRANENADSYYKLYSSERDAHKKASTMVDDLNADVLNIREIVAGKCDHWARGIWDYINSQKVDDDSDVMGLREMANDIFDFGANDAEGMMEECKEESEE